MTIQLLALRYAHCGTLARLIVSLESTGPLLADPHCHDADSDPAFHFNTNPDSPFLIWYRQRKKIL
jgi:hypothetical protein